MIFLIVQLKEKSKHVLKSFIQNELKLLLKLNVYTVLCL